MVSLIKNFSQHAPRACTQMARTKYTMASLTSSMHHLSIAPITTSTCTPNLPKECGALTVLDYHRDVRKVAVCGTHGVGKTTLTRLMAAECEVKKIPVAIIKEAVRQSRLPVNANMVPATAIAASSAQIKREIELTYLSPAKILICDRSALDTIIYAQHGKMMNPMLVAQREAARQWLRSYDLFVWIRPDEDLHIFNDGFRSTDKAFQTAIDKLFEEDFYPLTKQNTLILRTNELFFGTGLNFHTRPFSEIYKHHTALQQLFTVLGTAQQ